MRFPISSLVFICISGVLLFLFIMFNYVFNDPDVGMNSKLNESAQQTLTGDRLTSWNHNLAQLKEGFGISSVLCFLVGVMIFLADLFGGRRQEGY